jgi:hypothetical protein
MAVLFDSALTAALGTELHRQWSGRRLEAVMFEERPRQVRLVFDDARWIWLLHPRLGFLLRQAPQPRRGRRSDRGVLAGRRLVDRVLVDPDTRRLALMFVAEPDAAPEQLVFELATQRRNAVYTADRVRALLHRRRGAADIHVGSAWDPPQSERLWAAEAPTRAAWDEHLHATVESADTLVGQIAYLSSLNKSFVFPEVAGPEALDSYERYVQLRESIRADPPEAWLLRSGTQWQPYPSSLENRAAEQAPSLLEAFRCVALRDDETKQAVRLADQNPETTAVAEALETRLDRAMRKLRALSVQLEAGRDAPELRDLGHLLLARKGSVPPGVGEVELEGFSGERIVVKLDPKLDAVSNAEAYYERARRLDRASRELPGRVAAAERAVDELRVALADLRETGPSPALMAAAGLAPGSGQRTTDVVAPGQRLPYRIYRTTGGLEIRVGRSARDNDALTFGHSSPDDIWMHVREAPGSHVVLRWGRRDQNPPTRDLTEAAVVAAVMSRARGSGLVPVSWTRRKYVRKPRKSGPGSVITQRAKTLFVEPDTKLVDRLADDQDARTTAG